MGEVGGLCLGGRHWLSLGWVVFCENFSGHKKTCMLKGGFAFFHLFENNKNFPQKFFFKKLNFFCFVNFFHYRYRGFFFGAIFKFSLKTQ